ncbi:hypothetical protein CTI12_AA629120 [Artemisia annua]|uniref:Uncharacterized protein n=1 Tax=Artemisia annua TaxID=35608 RepID=A0A2U1K9E5_ARTAN|nr:hypothetical protein CTI12_AA629120 [Artemisia annua]
MEKYRSQSCRDNGMMDMSNNGGYPNSMKDLRSYTTNRNMKKSASKNWMSDPEVQRKKRVAGYKVYGMESEFVDLLDYDKEGIEYVVLYIKPHCLNDTWFKNYSSEKETESLTHCT